jgi:hypothetical protein
MRCWWQTPPAAAAGYELELRAERRDEGIAARRRRAEGTMLPGKKRIGRPCAVGQAGLRQLQRMTGEGATVTQAARILKNLPLYRADVSPRQEAVDICILHV